MLSPAERTAEIQAMSTTDLAVALDYARAHADWRYEQGQQATDTETYITLIEAELERRVP